ncbi:MAG: hypothetical protein Q4E22_07050 [Coriobacteriia bacterium]|nr:hypothetical protein [Coriobacteriia bacterium]
MVNRIRKIGKKVTIFYMLCIVLLLSVMFTGYAGNLPKLKTEPIAEIDKQYEALRIEMENIYGDYENWSIEQKARLDQTFEMQNLESRGALLGLPNVSLGEPTESSVSMEEAVRSAKSDLTEVIGLSYEEAKEVKQEAYFIAISAENDIVEYAWLILHVSDADAIIARSLLSYDGLFIDVAEGVKPFYRTSVPKSLPNSETEDTHMPFFAQLSLEEKVKKSEEWRPLIEEHLKEYPDYKGEDGLVMYHATRFKYGLPSANDITQEEALKLAVEAAKKIGANIDALDLSCSLFFFDITNPELPLWKITLKNPDGGQRYIFRVLLDARTGETISAEEIPLGVPYWEYHF